MSKVNVPPPLSNAPRPSGIPTIRYGVPSGFKFTESPTVRIDFVTMPDSARRMYGDCELLGPVCAPGSAIATADATPATSTASANIRILFTGIPLWIDLDQPARDAEGLKSAAGRQTGCQAVANW